MSPSSPRDAVGTLMEFHRYADSAENNQQLEIERIQGFVMEELQRQNQLANDTKFTCERKLMELQNVLEEVSQCPRDIFCLVRGLLCKLGSSLLYK